MHCRATTEPASLTSLLYTEVEKYARSDADHRKSVEQRKLMRRQQGWPHGNQNSTRHNPQYIFPVEPSQRADPHHDVEPYMTPPASQTFNSQPSNHRHDSHRRQIHPRPRAWQRPRSGTSGSTEKVLLSFPKSRVRSHHESLPRKEEDPQ